MTISSDMMTRDALPWRAVADDAPRRRAPSAAMARRLVGAVEHGDHATASYLVGVGHSPNLRRDDGDGRGSVHVAAAAGDLAGLRQVLVTLRADPNVRSRGGDLPLHVALAAGWTAGARLLLAAGADPLRVDGRGRIALHAAAAGGLTKRVAALLDLVEHTRAHALPAADHLHAADAAGDTALHLAIRAGASDVAAQLLAYAAALDAEVPYHGPLGRRANHRGETPLALAREAAAAAVARDDGDAAQRWQACVHACMPSRPWPLSWLDRLAARVRTR